MMAATAAAVSAVVVAAANAPSPTDIAAVVDNVNALTSQVQALTGSLCVKTSLPLPGLARQPDAPRAFPGAKEKGRRGAGPSLQRNQLRRFGDIPRL
jgi:hypothetical protein